MATLASSVMGLGTIAPVSDKSHRQTAGAAQDAFVKAIIAKLEYLTPGDVALLQSKAKPLFFTAGEKLISEGALSPGFFMLRSGEAEVRRADLRLAGFVPGDICGEMSFLESSNASASVIATSAATAEFLSVTDLTDIFASFPHLASRFYRSVSLALSRRLRSTSAQLVTAQNELAKRSAR